jgi:hypothetical protein
MPDHPERRILEQLDLWDPLASLPHVQDVVEASLTLKDYGRTSILDLASARLSENTVAIASAHASWLAARVQATSAALITCAVSQISASRSLAVSRGNIKVLGTNGRQTSSDPDAQALSALRHKANEYRERLESNPFEQKAGISLSSGEKGGCQAFSNLAATEQGIRAEAECLAQLESLLLSFQELPVDLNLARLSVAEKRETLVGRVSNAFF